MNIWLASLFGKKSGEKINCRINALNSDERDEVEEISKKEFLKAFEIYIHAAHYDTEDAFGCKQGPGPGPLGNC